MRPLVLITSLLILACLFVALVLLGPLVKTRQAASLSERQFTPVSSETESLGVIREEISRSEQTSEPTAAPEAAASTVAIAGVVRVDGGPPREPVSLQLRAKDGPVQDEQRVAVDPDGRFRFERLPAGFQGNIEVPRRYSVAQSDPRARFIPVEAPQDALVLDLERWPCLTGRLVSREDGQPVEDPRLGASISWVEGGNMLTGAEFEDNARFFIMLVENKEIASASLRAWGSGLLGSFEFTREEIPPDLDLGDLALTAGGIVHLIVLAPERSPVAGARVGAGTGGVPKETNSEGRITLEGVPPNATLEVLARGFDPRRIAAPTSNDPLEVVLERANRLTIRILNAAGDPEPGVRLRVSAEAPLFVESKETISKFLVPQVPELGKIAGREGTEFSCMFVADERGMVELQSLLPGLPLVLHVEDELESEVREEFVAPLRGQEDRTLTIRLSRDPSVVQGLVEDQFGEPLDQAKVVLLGGDHGMTRVTGADGRFQFDRLYTEKAAMRIERRGYVTARLPGLPIPNATPLRVVLDPGRDVEVRVVDALGERISDGSVVAWLLDESRSWFAKEPNDGLRHFLDIPQLELEIRVSLAGTEFRKALGASAEEIEIQVPTCGRLEVSYDVAPKFPQERLGLRLRSIEDESIEQFRILRSNDSGAAVFESVLPGSYELTFATWKKEGTENKIVPLGTPERVQVEPGDTTHVQLQ